MTDSVFDTPLLTVREVELLARAKREMETVHASALSMMQHRNEILRGRVRKLEENFLRARDLLTVCTEAAGLSLVGNRA